MAHDTEQDFSALCKKFLPLLAQYEGWPMGKLQHMLATGEAVQIGVVLAMIQEQSLTDKQMAKRIASGEVSKVLRNLSDATKSDADPTPHLFKAISAGKPMVDSIFQALETHLDRNAKGFAVDLASGSAFYPQNIVRRWPGLKVYPTDHLQEKHALTGTDFLNWCLQQFAESPVRDFVQLAQRDAVRGSAVAAQEAEVNLLDTVWYPSAPPYPDPQKDRSLSYQLWDRVSDVDVTTEDWQEVGHLLGTCRLVTCTSFIVQVGYRDADGWRPMVRGAARLLAPGGVLLLYDTAKFGGFLDKETMQAFCHEEALGLTVVHHSGPTSSSDPGDLMTLEVLRKEIVDEDLAFAEARARQSRELASSYRDRGNQLFTAKIGRDVQRAISLYTKALDALAAACCTDREMLSRLESNRSASLLEVGRAAEALEAADRAIQWDSNWPKAQFRRAKALMALGRDGEAMAASLLVEELSAQANSSSLPKQVPGVAEQGPSRCLLADDACSSPTACTAEAAFKASAGDDHARGRNMRRIGLGCLEPLRHCVPCRSTGSARST